MATRDGGMKSTSINGVKMYTIASQQPSLASWLPSNKKQNSHRNVKSYTQNLQLLEDLRFATAATKIKATPDGEYIIASGIYPPQVKVYEVRELGLKFERHLDSEIVDFQVLTDDYSKLAFLCADRSVYLHAKYGKHYSLRIPRMGRDIAYDCWSCDLLCAASSPDLYRINLEQGRFLSSLNTQSPALNVVSRSKIHGLVACGGEDGAVECFDMRVRSSVGRIDAVGPSGDVDQEVTALEFDEDGGFLLAVGSSAGKVLIYDLRSSHPVRIQDHMYGSSILDIKWHRTLNYEQPMLITSDNHVVRIWDPETGEGLTSIEPTTGTINDVCTFPGSGLILLALDCSQIPSYFIPSFGPAPKWCSSLENFTAKALVDPFEYEAYIEQQKREKMEAERASRITEFEIKDSSQEYLALHPMGSKKQTSLLKEHFEPVMMYEIKNEQHAEAFWSQKSLAGEDSLPMGDRVAALKDNQQPSRVPNGVKQGPGGSREITFSTRSSAKYKEDEEDKEVPHRKKRGVQSLGLKPQRPVFRGQGRGKRGNGRRGRR
ncbi:hypothetical protein JHK82_018107 [Glycine max]|nr:hypothetical protein JHK82_018107 [Glycine max]